MKATQFNKSNISRPTDGLAQLNKSTFWEAAPVPKFLRPVLKRTSIFFDRLQWKLTLAYTIFTVGTILILAIVALILLWYLNFRSSIYPNAVADALSKATTPLTPYLAELPPDQVQLQQWLNSAIRDDYLMLTLPKDDGEGSSERVPGYFGKVEMAAVVDNTGRVLAVQSASRINPANNFSDQLATETGALIEHALSGEQDTTRLARRHDGYLSAAVPIFADDNQVLGAFVFTTDAFPVSEAEFLQNVLRQMILPFAGIMLVVGIIVGAIFGYLLSRGIVRRLQLLGHTADAWSEGNFQVLSQDASGDEVGRLSRHLNHMAVQLQNLMQTRQELAGLEERNRLARDLHDSVKQQVFATAMQVGAARALIDRDVSQSKSHLFEAEKLVRQAQQELTALILELRPAALEGKGLAKALRDYVDDWSRQTKIEAEVRISGERPLPLPVEQTLFRIAQEALANIARHSQASFAELYLSWQDHTIKLMISDDGQGFNPAGVKSNIGVGLKSMTERIEVLGGQLTVWSQPQAGTQVTAQITIRQE